jgi:hypothetical protein
MILDWLATAIPTSALTIILLLLCRGLIETRLTKSVQHEFDKKIESVKSDLRNSETSLQATIRASEAQLDALRSGALTGIVSRQAVIDKRRVGAVDQLWAGILAIAPAKVAVMNTSILNFEAASKASVHDAKAAALFGTMGGSIDAEKIYSIEPAKARPHISPLAWAQFEAYRAMLGFSVSQFKMLKLQIEDPQDLLNFQGIIDLVGTALPHRMEYLKAEGPKAQVHLVDELEQAILQELKRVLSGADDDAQAIDLAAAILAKAEHVNAELTEARKVEKKHGG